MNDELLSPADFERLAAEYGISMNSLADQAGIARSTFTRWKQGKTRPRLDVYMRLRDVLRAAAAKVAA